MAASMVDDDDDIVMMTDEEIQEYVHTKLTELNFGFTYAQVMTTIQARIALEQRETETLSQVFEDVESALNAIESRLDVIDPKTSNGRNDEMDVVIVDDDSNNVQNQTLTSPDKQRPRSAGNQGTSDTSTQKVPTLGAASTSSALLAQLTSMRSQHQALGLSAKAMTILNHPPPKLSDLAAGMKLYARKADDIWYKGTLVDVQNASKPVHERRYKIKFDDKGLKSVGSKFIAYTTPLRENVVVGTRVIAKYFDEQQQSAFYAGIIAEPPSLRNNNRFLVFFEDGYAQYSQISQIHQVYDQSVHVWEDIHPDSQDFIRSYLEQYPERPMVRLQPGQVIQTEWNGNWYPARVLEVDASLVKMYFDEDNRTEWIYRGSTRLEPLYTELANAEASKQSASSKVRRRSNLNINSQKRPFVEYTRGHEDDLPRKLSALHRQPGATATASASIVDLTASEVLRKQATAKKSTGSGPRPCQGSGSKSSIGSTADDHSQHSSSAAEGEQIDLTLEDDMVSEADGTEPRRRRYNRSNSAPSLENVASNSAHGEVKTVDMSHITDLALTKFVPHICCHDCLRGDDNPAKFKGHNPLLIPMDFLWNRQVSKHMCPMMKRTVFYVTPCRRRLRNENEVDRYLVVTDSWLTIDFFCFDPDLRVDTEFMSIKTFCDIKDLSYHKENVPVPCVNGLQRDYPDYVEYSNQRIPAPGVCLNLDEEFLTGCDCTDGCRDRSRCQCIRMTIEESKKLPSYARPLKPGYQNRRLTKGIFTGIYECNSRCKCDSRCHNRVVQHGLTARLQVFRTEKRGWGLRCLNDIPVGGFICIYAGQLLNDEGANEDGKMFGDEYLAELDLIEVVEKYKEGYESDVEDPDKDSASKGSESESDFEPNTNRDSDSTYSGERKFSKRVTRQMSKKERSSKTDKTSDKVEKKPKKQTQAAKTKKGELAAKMTAAWVDSITISDDNDDENEDVDVDGNEGKTPLEKAGEQTEGEAEKGTAESATESPQQSTHGKLKTGESKFFIGEKSSDDSASADHLDRKNLDETGSGAPISKNDDVKDPEKSEDSSSLATKSDDTDNDAKMNIRIDSAAEGKGSSEITNAISADSATKDESRTATEVTFGCPQDIKAGAKCETIEKDSALINSSSVIATVAVADPGIESKGSDNTVADRLEEHLDDGCTGNVSENISASETGLDFASAKNEQTGNAVSTDEAPSDMGDDGGDVSSSTLEKKEQDGNTATTAEAPADMDFGGGDAKKNELTSNTITAKAPSDMDVEGDNLGGSTFERREEIGNTATASDVPQDNKDSDSDLEISIGDPAEESEPCDNSVTAAETPQIMNDNDLDSRAGNTENADYSRHDPDIFSAMQALPEADVNTELGENMAVETDSLAMTEIDQNAITENLSNAIDDDMNSTVLHIASISESDFNETGPVTAPADNDISNQVSADGFELPDVTADGNDDALKTDDGNSPGMSTLESPGVVVASVVGGADAADIHEVADGNQSADRAAEDAANVGERGPAEIEMYLAGDIGASGDGTKEGESKPELKDGSTADLETNLMITELTSLNTDNIEIESDDNDDHTTDTQSKAEEEESVRTTRSGSKRTTNSQSSRFRNLPDPKSQKPVGKSATQQGSKSASSVKLAKPPPKVVKEKRSLISTRQLFGEEYCYIMDAKSVGNLGRYLNHSCDPNVFVQNVFVDTHDLRFPWVAFFALRHIAAGSELTWDYNYEVGSVVDKMLYCYCGAAECRGRLL